MLTFRQILAFLLFSISFINVAFGQEFVCWEDFPEPSTRHYDYVLNSKAKYPFCDFNWAAYRISNIKEGYLIYYFDETLPNPVQLKMEGLSINGKQSGKRNIIV